MHNGRTPFPLQQSLPQPHHTVVYSVQPARQATNERAGHGQATTEQN